MYEYGLIHHTTGEHKVIFGYDYANACKRANINPADPSWELDYSEYID